MPARQVGIRELKSSLSACVREVKTGGTIVVTEHGRPVARIIPDSAPDTDSWRQRMEDLVATGAIQWSGKRFQPPKLRGRVSGKRTVSDLIIENRE